MKALILAAGYATRLYPLTKEYPKPLLKIEGRPIIDYILEKLEALSSLDEIVVITNSKFISQFGRWRQGIPCKKRISLVDDLTSTNRSRRGAIADMNFAIEKGRIKDDLLVIGGDNLFNKDLKGFLHFAKAHYPHPAIGAYDIKDKQEAAKYGLIKLDREKKIVDFKEKPKRPESTLVAMCLYYFPKDKLGFVKEYLDNKKQKRDATGLYIDWLRKRMPVYGFVFSGLWYDIGDPDFYREAEKGFQ